MNSGKILYLSQNDVKTIDLPMPDIIEALEGMFVEPGMNLYRIADLSTVWAHVDVYESDFGVCRVVMSRWMPLTSWASSTTTKSKGICVRSASCAASRLNNPA